MTRAKKTGKDRVPSLRHHKPTQQGAVRLNGRDHYLGKWPRGQKEAPTEVRAAYDRTIAEWLAGGRRPLPRGGLLPEGGQPTQAGAAAPVPAVPAGLTVAELLVRFMAWAEGYYRRPDRTPTSEVANYRNSLRPLHHLYGRSAAAELGPRGLEAVRELMVRGYDHPDYGPQPPLKRRLINQRVGRIKRVFRWGVAKELLPVTTYQALAALDGLKVGRCEAEESEPVQPVPVADVEATLPHLSDHLRAAVLFQLHTGARPGEALAVRLADIDRTGPVWMYHPPGHKTAWRGKRRVVAIGPKGQAALLALVRIRCPVCGVEGRPPRLGSRDGIVCGPCADRLEEQGIAGAWPRIECHEATAYLVSPRDARSEHDLDRRARRTTRVQPSQKARRKKARPKRAPGQRYGSSAYGRAIARARDLAGVPHWHPHQLRHTHATEVRKRYGLEAAQVTLGHAQAQITEVYAQRDWSLAARVASEMG